MLIFWSFPVIYFPSNQCYNPPVMKSFDLKYPVVAHIGKNVSHAKNRTSRAFKRNLHTVTVMVDGVRKRYKVPTKILRLMKKQGATTHWQNQQAQTDDAAANQS